MQFDGPQSPVVAVFLFDGIFSQVPEAWPPVLTPRPCDPPLPTV